ncbi:PAS domain S-box-containing protein [Sphingomonas jinjuensis]|uniref:histidine kinase n=1 Tax=Sphingomonas jinjuensis TaxID=535907 RepID=A0A840FGF6_9SPHN|nr:PAS domain-containing protein [Sphingomonas jinjuensis]MBB4152425.1 PAS domain S-box-containing protein [Sphingomonas jinjuensis]
MVAATTIPAFLQHPASHVATEIAAYDWSRTALGPIEGWPVALRTTLATMLACPVPMFLAYGPDLQSFYNDAYRPILGYRAAIAMGMPFRTLWGSIWDEIAPMVDAALAGESPMVTDMRLDLGRGGAPEESYWSFSYSPAFDDAGAIAGMLCVTSETTARVLAERSRDEADERLQIALSAGNSIGVWDWDVQRDWVRSDRRFAELYGVDPARAATGAPIAAFFAGIHSDDIDRVRAEIDVAMTEGGTFRSEYRLVRCDGRVRWVTAQGRCVFDAHGRCVRFPGASFDITDEVERRERLRESEAVARETTERLQLALEAGAIIGTWFWDLPSNRFTVDEPFARFFGVSDEQRQAGLSLDRVVSMVHDDDRPGLVVAVNEAIARGGAYVHQYRVTRPDGGFVWLEAKGRVDRAADGTPLSFPGVLIDIGARHAIEVERDAALADLTALNDELENRVAERSAELMRAEEALRQSQKMEAVGQLTGGLAHDFNNLLAGISGAMELIDMRIGQGRVGEVGKYIAAAQSATKRAASLTHRLLAFSRRQTLAPRPTDVNALVVGMSELIERTVGPGIAVETIAQAGLWTALVDASQLENALLNLCINARDAMAAGGAITIATANRTFDADHARGLDLAAGDYLVLSVADTGDGMTPEVIAKAFDPFFTTKPLGQGTGLGLSMIYGFAQQSGGQVRIESAFGEGTTVSVYLPRHHGDAERDDAFGQPPTHHARSDERTVLVVEDEPTVRMLVTDLVADLGHSAIEAHDSAAGLRLLHSDARIDLLVTDVGLPGGMNGRQMADAGRADRPGLKVIFITGYAESSILDHGRLGAGMQVLTKPFAIEALADRIRTALA